MFCYLYCEQAVLYINMVWLGLELRSNDLHFSHHRLNANFNSCHTESVWIHWLFFPADGSSGFKAEAGRYHLYVSLACPWANRVLIVRNLKGLQDILPYTVVDWFLGEKGWAFTDKVDKGSHLQTCNGWRNPVTQIIWHLYKLSKMNFTFGLLLSFRISLSLTYPAQSY